MELPEGKPTLTQFQRLEIAKLATEIVCRVGPVDISEPDPTGLFNAVFDAIALKVAGCD